MLRQTAPSDRKQAKSRQIMKRAITSLAQEVTSNKTLPVRKPSHLSHLKRRAHPGQESGEKNLSVDGRNPQFTVTLRTGSTATNMDTSL